MIGDNEGSVMIQGRLPNVCGRGESFLMEYSYGSKKSTSINLSAVKPFFGSKFKKMYGFIFTQLYTHYPIAD